MALTIDPAFAAILAAQAQATIDAGIIAVPARGDALALRELINPGFPDFFAQAAPAPDVSYSPHFVAGADGAEIELRWYTRGDERPGPAVVYLHGGGMICGSIEYYDPVVRQYVQWTGVPFLSVEYRLAPEFPGEIPARDGFAGLTWLLERADQLGVDPTRLALMGDSAGGGVAAGAAILARNAGLPAAKQILIYPMLDDRNTEPDPFLAPTATWNYDQNYTGWKALMGDSLGADEASSIAAPARLQDFSGLAPAYIEVGVLDIFRDESIAYAQNLLKAGVDTELHVHPGAPHGHEWLDVTLPFAKRIWADRVRAITDF